VICSLIGFWWCAIPPSVKPWFTLRTSRFLSPKRRFAWCFAPIRFARQNTFGERGAKLYAVQDATIAAAYAQLAIVAAGMGSTWVGYFEEDKVCEALSLEAGLVPIALISLGYPAELPEPSSRRRLHEVVAWR
jgi:nitroreductase